MRLKDYFLFLCLLIGILVARYVATPLQDRALAIRVIIAGGPLVLIMFAWFSYRTRRARGENPGPWQLRFGPRGCFGPGKVELTPRTKITKVEAQSIDGQSWAFRIVRRTQALSWRFQRCEVDVEASSTIVVAAGETDIRLLMQRLGEWIGDNVVWINSPGGKQSASVRRNEGVK